jgi:hypothetical protein
MSLASGSRLGPYDERLLVNKVTTPAAPPPVTLVVNWLAARQNSDR